ncbi:5279_t:CDS:2 [Acaulospora morrowiae]|uniref:5279_t:CDS:1 n=1 Tax=Acaulospora morrowiae TaxID=94023 RepID=A0A9N9C6Y7_9GLOM|nr:5279_t:CDS:2 [Acaulospora morrowiae]
MTEVEFNPISIYNKLTTLRTKPQSGGKTNNGEAQLVSSLKVEAAAVTKEINRYRACVDSSCLYCREWTLFVHKKGYTWAAKNKDPSNTGVIRNISDGQTNDCLSDKPKEAAADKCQQFHDLIGNYKSRLKPTDIVYERLDPFDDIVHKVFDWIKAPSNLYTSPNPFVLVEFDYPNRVHLNHDQENNSPVSLLEKMEVEKIHYQISRENFPLLKLATLPTQCHHTRPEWKHPSELDIDRRAFNDQMVREKSLNDEMLKVVDQIWKFVQSFLDAILELEANRDLNFGKGCVQNLNDFLKEYQDKIILFKDYWAPVAEAYKKTSKSKKGGNISSPPSGNAVDDIDLAFHTYVTNFKTILSLWEEDFIEKVYVNSAKFIDDAQSVLMRHLIEVSSRIGNGRVSEFYPDAVQKCKIAQNIVKDMKLMASKRYSTMRNDISKRKDDLLTDIKNIEADWNDNSQRTILGRLEKANNKEFQKKIKKFENSWLSLKQFSILTIGNILPATDFASVCIQCLELLMMEGEMWEAIELGKHYKKYEQNFKKFDEQRERLLKDFCQGVETGQKVLSGIIGRLFLKEAQRLQEDSLALKKQDAFLNSIDQGKIDSESQPKMENPLEPSIDDGVMSTASDSKKIMQQKLLENMIAENSTMNYESLLSFDGNLVLDDCLNDTQAIESQLSVPPGLNSNTIDIQRQSIADSQHGLANPFNLDELDRSNLISVIQCLTSEKTQLISSLLSLQHELQSMNIRYAKLLEVSRDREFQNFQILETRKQEMEEKMRYIQKLELRISQLESQNQTGSISESISPINNSLPGSPSTNQITQLSYGPIIFPATSHAGNSVLGSNRYVNPWRSSNVNRNGVRSTNNLRCGNCGELGHVSQECSTGCRYCSSFEHLSESCNLSGYEDNLTQTGINKEEISTSNNRIIVESNESK